MQRGSVQVGSNQRRLVIQAVRLLGLMVLSVACASVLGIETTKRTDRASESYASGYTGCRQSNCKECLSNAHRSSCEGTQGYGTSGYDGCRLGDCGECASSAHRDLCEGERGYGAGYSGCSEGMCGNCVSDEHHCLCRGLPAQCFGGGSADAGLDPQICDQSNLDECAECVCGSCELSTCLEDAACNAVFSCVTQNPCSPFATDSTTCYVDEFCKDVIDNAGGIGGSAYASMLGVINCAVQNTCPCAFEAPSPSGNCDAGEGCDTEGGTGPNPEACQVGTDCLDCATAVERCACIEATVPACLQSALGNMQCEAYFNAEQDRCNSCACTDCENQILNCVEDGACMTLMQCMNITGCSGNECDQEDTCADTLAERGGVRGGSFLLATELVACQQAQECPCVHEGDETVRSCGEQQCTPHADPESEGGSLAACCFTQQGNQYCGLDVSGVLYSTCEPKNQTGQASNSCPDYLTPDRFPYHGALLQGCCRPGNTGCGYADNITGLGCIQPYVIDGVTTTPMPCQ